jgi:hypothetical protein
MIVREIMPRPTAEELEALSLSALGWFNFALSYCQAADLLVDQKRKLPFDDPVRALYAQAWELALKACLLRQGVSRRALRIQYGHDLLKIWHGVNRSRFPSLKLTDRLALLLAHLQPFHELRLYSYPSGGLRTEFTLQYLRAQSERLHVARDQIIDIFGSP